MKLRKPAYAALAFAIITFINPNFNAFDILPDFIGAFIIASLLSRAEDVVPFFTEAKDAFMKLGITSLIRLPAAVIMFTNLHTGMDIVPLFTLVFTVIELILIYSGVLNAARGLYYLAQRTAAVGIVKPLKLFGIGIKAESVRNFTLVFLSLRALLNFLPQICHLTFTDGRVRYIANRLYAPLEIGGMATVLLVGIIWGILAISYLRNVKRYGGVADGIEYIAGEAGLARIRQMANVKSYVRSLTLFAVSGLFSMDVALLETNGFNILPHFIFVTLMLISVYRLTQSRRIRLSLLVSGVVASVLGAISFVITRSFSEQFGIRDIAEYTVASEAFGRIEVVTVIETLALLIFISVLAISLRAFLLTHTGISPEAEEYGQSERNYHRTLCRRVYILLAILAAAVVLKCVNIFLIGSPIKINSENAVIYSPRLPWLSTVILALDLFYFLRSIWVVKDLKEEVKFKYQD